MSNFSNNNSITELILLRETGRSKINKVVFIDLKEIPDRKRWQDKYTVFLNGIQIFTEDSLLSLQKIIDNICDGCKEKGLMYIVRDHCK